MDLLSGRCDPELGGAPRYLDLVGLNYYYGNQSELGTGHPLGWRLDDPRRVSLNVLLERVYARYSRPLVVAETSHVGVGRGAWIREVATEVALARENRVPVEGICVYPIIDRPEWENDSLWHRSGLWDMELDGRGMLQRRLNTSYAAALREIQAIVPGICDQKRKRHSSPSTRIRALKRSPAR